jgi:hypothetical protein
VSLRSLLECSVPTALGPRRIEGVETARVGRGPSRSGSVAGSQAGQALREAAPKRGRVWKLGGDLTRLQLVEASLRHAVKPRQDVRRQPDAGELLVLVQLVAAAQVKTISAETSASVPPDDARLPEHAPRLRRVLGSSVRS